MTQNSLPGPAQVQRHLHRVRYPAGRDDLISHAKSECARVVHALHMLPDREYARPADVNKALRDLVRVYIDGAHYPVRRDDVIEYALGTGADQALLEALRRIPNQRYPSVDAVITEMSDVDES